jgi:hypothetical protein
MYNLIFKINPDEFHSNIHKWQSKNQSAIDKNSIKIIYKISKNFSVMLESDKIKYTFYDMDNFATFFSKNFKNDTNKLDSFDFCGLPKSDNTTHCFSDSTHRTCCLLGKKARDYADNSGNPIGKASERQFYLKNGFYPDSTTLTPWCTCMGSKVCSFYQKKFGSKDGTHIKFLYDKNNNIILSNNEDEYNEDEYAIYKHKTPGINF